MIARRAGMWTFEFVVSAPCFSRSQSRTSSWSDCSAAVYQQRLALTVIVISDLARLVSVNGKLVLTNQNLNHAKVFIGAENFECNSPQHMHDDEPVTCMGHEELCRPTVLRCGTIKLKMFLRT